MIAENFNEIETLLICIKYLTKHIYVDIFFGSVFFSILKWIPFHFFMFTTNVQNIVVFILCAVISMGKLTQK